MISSFHLRYCASAFMARLCLAACCLLWTLSAVRAQTAGQIDPTFGASLGLAAHTNAMILQPDGKILVVGSFAKGILRFNADSTLDSSFNPGTGADSYVHAVAVSPDGRIVIGGEFYSYNGVARRKFARLNADGSLDTTFNPGTGASGSQGDGEVIAVAVQPDGQVVIGGLFNSVNGTNCTYLARLHTDGSVDTGYVPTLDSWPQSLTMLPNGQVLLQGYFYQVNNTLRRNLARLTATGSLDTTFNPTVTAYNIQCCAPQADGHVLVGCYNYNNGAQYFVARLDGSGNVDPAYPSVPTDSMLNGIAVQTDGRAVIGGDFDTVGGVTHHHLARLNTDGTLDGTFDSGTITDTNCSPAAVASNGDILYLYGSGDPCCVHANGGQNAQFKPDAAPGPDAFCECAFPDNSGRVILGGYFDAVSGVPDHGLTRLLADGTPDATFAPAPGLNGPAFCGAVQTDGKLLVGGTFSAASGAVRSRVARFNVDGSLDTGFTTGPYDNQGGDVSSISLLANGNIVIAGQFNNYGTVSRGSAARLLPDGTLDTTFDPGTRLAGGASGVAVQTDGKMVFGGFFTTANGAATNGLARVNTDGTADATFNVGTGTDNNVVAVVMQGTKVLAGGLFNTVNGVSRPYLARLLPGGAMDTTFNPSGSGPDNDVEAVALQPTDGKILIGGLFSSYNGVVRQGVARLNTDGTLDTTFNLAGGISGGVYTYIKSVTPLGNGQILIGGQFTTVGGVVRNYAARLNADGSVDPTFNPGLGSPSVSALALQPNDGNVVVGGTFTTAGNQPANALARLHPDGSLDTSFVAPFSPGDSVQTLARQPADGNIVAAALLASGSSPTGMALVAGTRSGVGPRTQSIVKNPIVRCLCTTAGLDPGFNGSAGTNGVTNSLALQANGQIVVGGSFTQLNSTTGHTNLGRLNADGTLDTAFAATTDAAVQAVAVQIDGRIIVGGAFAHVGATACPGLARLLSTGALDGSFAASAGTNGTIAALKLQSDGRVVAGGTFTTAAGSAQSCIARFSTAGVLDHTFNPGTFQAASGAVVVNSIDQQSDGKLVIVGNFSQIGSYARNRVARLNTDGSVDTTYDPGAGPNAVVRATMLQPDGKALLGGDFATVDGVQHNAAARLLSDYPVSAYPPLLQWRVANFGQEYATGTAADTAAPYGDGVANLVKYALNMNAQAADATAMTATGTKGLPLLGRDASGKYLTLTFVRRQAATSPGVTYLVEFNNALANPSGFAVNPAATSSVTTLNATWERVTVTDSVPITAQAPSRFIHLHVTDP